MTEGSSGATLEGLPEFRRALRAIGPEWPKALRAVHKKIADEGARRSQSVARASGKVQAKAAGAIKGKASQRDARIGVSGGKRYPMANVAFWGAKKRTGWYARQKYADSQAVQHPVWVGNAWDVAVAGQGPYAINTALAIFLPSILEMYQRLLDDLAHAAFPEP